MPKIHVNWKQGNGQGVSPFTVPLYDGEAFAGAWAPQALIWGVRFCRVSYSTHCTGKAEPRSRLMSRGTGSC